MSLPALSGPPGAAPAETPSAVHRKLQKAAAEFEAQLLASLWKSMKSSFASPDDEAADPARQSLEEWGIDAMCGAVGKAGGLGIGKRIVQALESKREPPTGAAGLFQNGKGVSAGGKVAAGSADKVFVGTQDRTKAH